MITGGKVTFKTPSGFEHKSAIVEISFDCEADLDRAAALAQTKAMEMVSARLQVATQPAEPKAVPVASPASAEVPPKAMKYPKKAKEAEPVAEKPQAAIDALPDPKPQLKGVDPVGPTDELQDVKPEITDDQLDKVGQAFLARVPGAGAKIRALRDKFTGNPQHVLRQLPQEKRQAFIDELATIK